MFEEIQKIFITEGFLVTKNQAAKILGKTKSRISQMIKEGKIKTITVLETEMIRLKDLQPDNWQ